MGDTSLEQEQEPQTETQSNYAPDFDEEYDAEECGMLLEVMFITLQ
jgi:hypothetical protein